MEGRDGPAASYTFSVDDLPDAEFYSIEVSDRGSIRYSAEELEQQDWGSISRWEAGSR